MVISFILLWQVLRNLKKRSLRPGFLGSLPRSCCIRELKGTGRIEQAGSPHGSRGEGFRGMDQRQYMSFKDILKTYFLYLDLTPLFGSISCSEHSMKCYHVFFPMCEISVFTNRVERVPLALPGHQDRASGHLQGQDHSLDIESADSVILDPPDPRTVRYKFLLFMSYPG